MIRLTPEPLPDHVTAPSTESKKAKSKSTKAKSSDRWSQLNDFVDLYLRTIQKQRAQLVWFVLFRHANENNIVKLVSYDRIGKEIGKSPETAKRAIGDLKKEGFLKVVKQGGYNRGPNIYKMVFPELQEVT